MTNIVKESFSLIAECQQSDGQKAYHILRPGEEEFQYDLLESEGKIVIRDAGDFIDSVLYLGGCPSTRGYEGNVRAYSTFVPVGYDSEISFRNPAAGQGGRLKETLDQVRIRFAREAADHYTAVEAVDYEKLVLTTPELCIHKVKAVMDVKKNQVSVAVKPYSRDEFPEMSNLYQEAIRRRLEERRLLTTRIELQQPVYVPVQVRGTVYVKSHFEGSREQIESVIRQELDYIHSDRNFGERLNFDALFHRLEELECVDFIYELKLTTQGGSHVTMQGLDIQPDDNCLLYPGAIQLEINTLD